MKISPVNIFKSNICSKGKTFTQKTKQGDCIETQNQTERNIPKELAAIQALNGFGFSSKNHLSTEELAKYVEHSINSGLEDKLLEYHKIILNAHKKHKNESSFEFEDKKGRTYRALHNFNTTGRSYYTIQVEQNYDGIPYDSKVHYIGYPGGKQPNPNHQTGFIHPHTNAGEIEYINYELRDFNLDDEHGCTDATIDANGTIKKISTGYDMLISPIQIQYNYENGILKNAHFRVYNNKYKGREAICTFDENRKIKQIHYPEKKCKCNEILPSETYIKNNNGKFILKTDE